MSRDVALDLEAGAPSSGFGRPAPVASSIAYERVGPGTPSVAFVLGTLALAAATLAVTLVLGARGAAALPAEEHAAGLVAWGDLGVHVTRVVAASAQAATVVGVALAARRLSHSEGAGLLAAALVAADPGGLLLGSLGVPQSVAVAGMVWALACVASPLPVLHWLAGLFLGIATLALPVAALWILPLALFLLLRGHIYAAPQHFGLSLAQVAIFPLLTLVLRFGLQGDLAAVPACLEMGLAQTFTLRHLASPGPDLLLLPNPVVWMAGAGAVAFLGLGGFGFALASFRIARAPGRLQVRLASPFPAVLGRGAWLLVLVVLAPPVVWLPLFAIALAMGIRELGDDAPGFGIALALVLLAFAGLILWRAWAAIAGDAGGLQDGLELVPWASSAAC